MKQPQWDKYEAAFLLEYCLKVENNELSRKEAITTVSEHLRERAKDRGFEIDEVFRNENGISMQMSAMRNCYLEKNKGLTISKLFKEVVALYKTNRNIFEKIIQEESSKVNKTIYQEFLLWLKTEKPNDTKEVIEYLSMLSMFVIKRKQLHKPIADITDADEIEHLQSIMNKPETLGIHSKKMSAKIDKALKMYLHFLHSKDKKDLSCLNCKSVLIEEKQSEDYFKVDFSSSQNYAHTKPVSCRYKGRNIPCSGWNSVFINITRAIYQDCHTKFPVGHSLSSSSRIDIGSPEGMVYPKEIANGIYLECNVSASGVVSKLRALMVICGMNYSDVVIEYRQNVKQSKVQKKTETAVIPSTQLQWMPHFTKELTELIAKYYKYGFRVGSPIELMRLRNYAESANVELPVSDEELEREVSVVGVLIDGSPLVQKAIADMEKYLDEKHGRVKETEHTTETVIGSGQKPSAVTADRRAEQESVSVSQSQPQKAEPASRAKGEVKKSVLQSLKDFQAKAKAQEQNKTTEKSKTHKKGEVEL